jgi:hypothetical protein
MKIKKLILLNYRKGAEAFQYFDGFSGEEMCREVFAGEKASRLQTTTGVIGI